MLSMETLFIHCSIEQFTYSHVDNATWSLYVEHYFSNNTIDSDSSDCKLIPFNSPAIYFVSFSSVYSNFISTILQPNHLESKFMAFSTPSQRWHTIPSLEMANRRHRSHNFISLSCRSNDK